MSAVAPVRTPHVRASAVAAKKHAPRAGRRRVRSFALGTLGVLASLLWVFPVYWMVLSAFTPAAYLRATTPQFLPLHATAVNFRRVLEGGSFTAALGMSVAITLLTVVLVLAFAFLGALAISRWKFRGRTSFVLAVLFIQMLPAEGLFIAQYKMLSGAHLLDSVIGVTVLYTAAIIPFTIWMLRGFVAGVPAELEEAAMVDGLSRTQAFLRITFPLLAPGLVASGVYAFLQAWNEFTIALVALNSNQTLPLWLRNFLSASANRGVDWGQVMAASTLIAIPVIVFFLFVQGRMTSGLVSGAVKG
ncbi:sugar ABC transporter permease [Cellulomonas sp. A375-1]|uniref:Sugar ABC transporter permease n=1 Tax=Cellulomonas gelida TaxID=1712 RepID=A0A4Y3KGS6_9CELL|nr:MULTISPECIES: carbohydrate ABC transporter permease [Cellulomonas]KMM46046.1 sugar ABC transporter permease [Cellulomonas sp. A375-1]GEA83192.1 sugar ABC transporter permease [Cellulomonas gelida]GGL29466.1 sugar ABC transporter permease [Cellulomonas gelida]